MVQGGRSHALSGADNSTQMHDGKGIVYSRRDGGDDKLLLNWSKVAKRIDYLISTDRYITAEEKVRLEGIQIDKAGLTESPPIPEITEPMEETSQEMIQDTTEKNYSYSL